jgi:hypothetical protein
LSRVLRWENLVGEFGRPQAQINPMVEVCDVFVGILADRLGSYTGVKESGFVEEYELARERRLAAVDGKPKIFIFSKEVSLLGIDSAELMRVKDFLDGLVERREVFVNRFATPQDLETALRQALLKFILEQIQAAPPSAEALAGGAGGDIRLASPSESPSPPKAEERPGGPPAAPVDIREEEPEPTAQARDWSDALTQAPLQAVGEFDGAGEAAEKAEQEPAIALLEGVAKRQLHRGSGLAEPTARRLMELQGSEAEWRGRSGRACWRLPRP